MHYLFYRVRFFPQEFLEKKFQTAPLTQGEAKQDSGPKNLLLGEPDPINHIQIFWYPPSLSLPYLSGAAKISAPLPPFISSFVALAFEGEFEGCVVRINDTGGGERGKGRDV